MENRKGGDVMKELKVMMTKLTDKLNETEKVKVQNFEKRMSEKKS